MVKHFTVGLALNFFSNSQAKRNVIGIHHQTKSTFYVHRLIFFLSWIETRPSIHPFHG